MRVTQLNGVVEVSDLFGWLSVSHNIVAIRVIVAPLWNYVEDYALILSSIMRLLQVGVVAVVEFKVSDTHICICPLHAILVSGHKRNHPSFNLMWQEVNLISTLHVVTTHDVQIGVLEYSRLDSINLDTANTGVHANHGVKERPFRQTHAVLRKVIEVVPLH